MHNDYHEEPEKCATSEKRLDVLSWPGAHPGERARRRCLLVYGYGAKVCPDMQTVRLALVSTATQLARCLQSVLVRAIGTNSR
jgi:hypothetical protein